MLIRTVQCALPLLLCSLTVLLPPLLSETPTVIRQGIVFLPWVMLCGAWAVSRLYSQPKTSFILLVCLLVYSLLQLYLQQVLPPQYNTLMLWLLCLLAPPLILIFELIPESMAGESSNWKCYLFIGLALNLGALLMIRVPEQSQQLLASLPGMTVGAPPLAGLILLISCMTVPLSMLFRRRQCVDLVALMALLVVGFAVCGFQVDCMPEVAFAALGGISIVLLIFHSYQLAFYDQLTGLRNRRSLEGMLNDLPSGYHLAMADIDHFKSFNDRFGHQVGDEALKLVAQLLSQVRGGGRVFRLGGEEFVILFRSRHRDMCANALDRVRRQVGAYPFRIRRPINQQGEADSEGKTETITISMGLVQHSIDDLHLDDVIRRADTVLYRAKRRGRNCIVVDDGRPFPWTVIGKGHTLP